jgi:hypothetical protein
MNNGGKEKTAMDRRLACILATGLLGAALDLHAADVPLGHKDFYPSPERPVGFRGDGNACYPGARPVAEFWDGTPAEVERPLLLESFGKKINPPKDGKTTAKVWDVTDEKSKNIVWKTRLPGWSPAEPIVVGDRVFAVGEPDWLTGLDAHAGKVLWQKRVLPLQLDGKTPEEAARLQGVIDIAAVFWILKGQAGSSMFLRLPPKECAPIAAKLVQRLPAWRKMVEAADNDPRLLEAFDRGAAAISRRAKPDAGEPDEADLKNLASGLREFVQAVERKYKVPVATEWYGMVGNAMSTPASDGERVCVAYGQGQVAAYDLRGNLLWGRRFPEYEHGKRGMCNLSPRLCDGILIVKSPNNTTWRGLDARTGRLVWERTGTKGNDYYTCTVLSLAARDGKPLRAVLYPNDLTIRRATDDAVLGQVPLVEEKQGYHVLTHNDLLWRGLHHTPEGAIFRLVVRDPGHIEAVKVADTNFPMHWAFHTSTPGSIIGNDSNRRGRRLYDFATGAEQGSFSPKSAENDGGTHCWTLGQRIFAVCESSGGNNAWWRGPMSYGGGQGGQGRPTDRKAMVRLSVIDVADPKAPKVLADRNLLQEPGPASDIFIEKYLDGIDPFLFAGTYHGSASFFGCFMGGPVACGNRVFVQSAVHLRCIGDPKAPYNWNPNSRPEPSAKEVAKP